MVLFGLAVMRMHKTLLLPPQVRELVSAEVIMHMGFPLVEAEVWLSCSLIGRILLKVQLPRSPCDILLLLVCQLQERFIVVVALPLFTVTQLGEEVLWSFMERSLSILARKWLNCMP